MQPESPSPDQGQIAVFYQRHRTGLVTLVFTDLVDSTALMRQLGDQAGTTFLQQRRQIVRQTLKEFPDGEEIETAGDSFLLIFAKPSDAVRFALLVQARFRAFRHEKQVGLFERIGIHLGEVVIKEHETEAKAKDLYGLQIGACARVMSLAQGGQVLMTRGVFDSARQVLKGEDIPGVGRLAWVSHGPYLLKGIEEPVEICEVGEVGQSPLTAPKTTEKAERYVTAESEPVLGWRPAIGQEVPNTKWILEEKLGEGGFGEVWLGRHQTMKERRVFKFCFRADRVRSLKREMTLFRLIKERIGDHPNIVSLREVYFDEPPFYVEMDYVAGQELKTWCEAQGGADKVGLEVKLEIVAQVADALQAAHDAGVIHRDVKPGNILVENPKSEIRNPKLICAKLTDFGIGQVISDEYLKGVTRAGFTQTMLSSSSSQTGTQLYMAPELLAGKPATTRSDIYSLGVVLYQLLVGDLAQPVTTDWAAAVPDPLLQEDLRHCLAGKPEDRFPGAMQLARNLRALEQRQADLAENQRLQHRAKQRQQVAVLAGMGAGVLLLLAIALGYGLAQARKERDRQRLFAYASDVRAADVAARENNLGQASDLLRRHIPTRGQSDLRGIEWRYLWQRCQGAQLLTLPHRSRVSSADISPEGRWIASECEGEVCLWEVSTARPIKRFESAPMSGVQQHVAFCPTGRYLATQGREGLEVWETSQWVKLTVLPVKNAVPVFSGDGRILAASADDGIRIWETGSWKSLVSPGELKIESTEECVMAMNRDGSLLAAVRRDPNEVMLWHVPSRTLKIRHADPDQPYSVALSPDGAWMAVGMYNGQIGWWTVPDGKLVARFPAHRLRVFGLAFSPDSQVLASAGNDQLIRLWQAGTTNHLATFKGHESEVWSVRFSGDGRWLASASKDTTVRLWPASPNLAKPASFTIPPDHLIGELSPDGSRIFTVNLKEPAFEEWDLAAQRVLRKVTITPLPEFNTLSGSPLRWTFLFRWDVLKRPGITGLVNMTVGRGPWGLAVGTCDGRILAWNRQTGGILYSNRVSEKPVFVGLNSPSADGKHLFFLEIASPGVGLGQLVPVWWNLTENRREVVVQDFLFPWSSPAVSVSKDGRWMAYPSTNQSFVIRNLQTDRVQAVLQGHTWSPMAVAFSPDGRFVATGSADATIQMWETATGRAFGPRLRGHFSGIAKLHFSADGRTLVSYGEEMSVRLWNVATGQQVLSEIPLAGLPFWHLINHLFSEDDGFCMEADEENQFRVTRLPTVAEIDAAENTKASAR